MSQTSSGELNSTDEVRFLPGVGPRRAETFAQLQVRTIGDLLEYYPRSHEFLPPLCLMDELEVDQNVTVAGQVATTRFNTRSRPARFEMSLRDANGQCRLIWFHGGYLRDKFLPGDMIAAWGKVSRYKESLQLVNPQWLKISGMEELTAAEQTGRAVYPACSELATGQIARIICQSLPDMLKTVQERYDEPFCTARDLPSRRDALQWIHSPPTADHIPKARRRLVYDEFFLMELAIALRREQNRQNQPAYPLQATDRLDPRIRQLFPFDLTEDQNKVIAEICLDLARSEPMNRLLQGDVGSGKTVVALYAALLAVGYHKQVAIMTPTEILAEQHFLSLERYLAHSRVNRILLTGGITGKARAELLGRIASGEIDLVVGTQALLQRDVVFNELALVVIDEQHKFGVQQRAGIRGKDVAPHCLVMTATPIPRTLAITVFGDLEVSTIEHLPPGRREVTTRWVQNDKLPEAYEFIRNKIRRGQQAYFVYPRVEEANLPEDALATEEFTPQAYAAGQLKAAVAEHKFLQTEVFPEFNVGLLHGQMERTEKAQTMEAFRAGKIHILVATVVIEVGVDVPNATIMVIEHADRFGLAQLHQLRGRIGRGEQKSYCLLFADQGSETSQQRLQIMSDTNDGFRIAEEDLRIRGPGEFFGTSQHGLPDLKIADLLKDTDLLRMARRDAFDLARADPQLSGPFGATLRRALRQTFGDTVALVDVG